MISDITREELKIRIHHVGGIGGYGPTGILSRLGDVKWIVYDAEAKALKISDKHSGGDTTFVNKCIGKKNYLGKFNVMHAKSASSMLPGAKGAYDYTVINDSGAAQIWGIHTQITKTYTTKVYSMDWLVKNGKIDEIDFLSMDVQGAELDILNGASDALKSTIIGVVTETDFSQLYSDQPLFCDVQNRLNRDNFRLFQIYNLQYFNSKSYVKELAGRGFLAVGESLFLKDKELKTSLSREEIIRSVKLAACAVVFDQLDFALNIVDFLVSNKLVSLESLSTKTNISYVKMLRDLYLAKMKIEKNIPALIYDSTNANDFLKKSRNKQVNVLAEGLSNVIRKLKLILTFWVINMVGGVFLSQISKIYEKYGLSDLAQIHERRLFEFQLFSKPSRVDNFLRFVLNQKVNFQPLLERRNYFKGKY